MYTYMYNYNVCNLFPARERLKDYRRSIQKLFVLSIMREMKSDILFWFLIGQRSL